MIALTTVVIAAYSARGKVSSHFDSPVASSLAAPPGQRHRGFSCSGPKPGKNLHFGFVGPAAGEFAEGRANPRFGILGNGFQQPPARHARRLDKLRVVQQHERLQRSRGRLAFGGAYLGKWRQTPASKAAAMRFQ